PYSVASFATGFAINNAVAIPLNNFTIDLTASATEYLVAQSDFSSGAVAAYGFIECQRTE
ncbi:MAG: hypothetical protein ACREDJ_07665, partial [Methylocella sp.]